MFYRFLYLNTALNRFHSADLADMHGAILSEDQDGPDGGTPHIARTSHRRMRSDLGR
ncbi:MAG: hypothetical protein RIG84_05615 [Roseovarius sp.]